MSRRSYGQTCGIARALDLLGERWTLLIIRDLLVGPCRYSDLLEGLPGIGTNLLADRLRVLEAEGLIHRRTLAPPAESVTVYDMTPAGRELESVLHELVRWSWRHLGRPAKGQRSDPRWTALALRAAFAPEAADGVDASYELQISGQTVWARVRDGTICTGVGSAEDPDVVLRSDDRTLAGIRAGELTFEEAVRRGRLRAEGTRAKIKQLLRVFSRT